MKKISRRDFLRFAGIGLSTLAAQQLLSSCGVQPPEETLLPEKFTPDSPATLSPTLTANSPTSPPTYPHLVVARGTDPEVNVRQGLKALGGIEQFMKPGADVIIKPNICVPYNNYEYASTTNPWVVGALVKLCLEGGAKRVRVMDFPFGGPAQDCYLSSGIQEQVIAAGGDMEVMQSIKYVTTDIPGAVRLKKVSVYSDILNADLLINVPIAKDHGLATLTLGLKNLMGTIQKREQIHTSFENSLVDLATLVRPQITVIDAMRTLMANGPTGGNLSDVKLQNTVILSQDIVAADSYATTLFGMTAQDIPYIIKAAERGLGSADLNSFKIQEVNTDA
jgi:uncharacterized protein (DUF362 family)